MALTHLVDTSVLTRMAQSEVRAVVEPMVGAGALGRALITDLEIGFSARSADEWDALVGALDVFPGVEVSEQHLRRAAQVQRMLAAASQRGRMIPDLLVAAVAEEAGLAVLHYDADFDRIAAVTGQAATWVVPAGTVP